MNIPAIPCGGRFWFEGTFWSLRIVYSLDGICYVIISGAGLDSATAKMSKAVKS